MNEAAPMSSQACHAAAPALESAKHPDLTPRLRTATDTFASSRTDEGYTRA